MAKDPVVTEDSIQLGMKGQFYFVKETEVAEQAPALMYHDDASAAKL
jgi:hypothetical protein